MTDTASRLQADYLTCSLCSQPFKQPKTLPCLHNFCKTCLSNYLEEEMKDGKAATFLCPECKEKIYVPDPSKPANRWAAQFPTNFTLSGMIEAIAKEMEEKGRGVAMVREARERRGMMADMTSGPKPTDKQKQDDSKEKDLPKSDSLDSDISPDVQTTLDRLEKLQEELRKENLRVDEDIAAIEQCQAQEKSKLDQSFARIYMLLEARKAQLLEDLTSNLAQEKARMQQMQQGFSNDLKSVGSCEELLKGLESKPVGDDVVYDMLQAIGDQIKEIKARRLSQVPLRSVRFEQTLESARSLLNLVNDLGQISISTPCFDEPSDDSSEQEETDGDSKTKLSRQETFDSIAKMPTKIRSKAKFLTTISTVQVDGKHQQIFDLTVTANGTVVMTSYGSNVVQAARKSGTESNSGYSVYAQLTLDTEPKCVAAIAPFFVAVTGTSCIYVLSVDDKLLLQRKIETGKNYQSIATYSEASLIVTSQKPACIDFVGLNGFISETVDRDHTTGHILLRQPQFMAASKNGVIYVTDLGKGPRLISINNAGLVRFQCPPEGGQSDESNAGINLDVPQGICVDSHGDIFVVDRSARKVILLTSEGIKVKDVLTGEDGLTDPCAIAVDSNDHVYVTNEFNEVLIFQVR
ncbi:tripartite motif-containing protein 56 [Elysia marginata]|uniref:Tripartite motif-containing protein 56 n=1 Tax=Elysia marginata TaxID=1093978 RepID=A0AAV4JST2_9GAST|nr:tripartite motif-containing protein 56 [Elysia marginata]